eukprot:352427-Chlamydomonas_euryale.AAC.8
MVGSAAGAVTPDGGRPGPAGHLVPPCALTSGMAVAGCAAPRPPAWCVAASRECLSAFRNVACDRACAARLRHTWRACGQVWAAGRFPHGALAQTHARMHAGSKRRDAACSAPMRACVRERGWVRRVDPGQHVLGAAVAARPAAAPATAAVVAAAAGSASSAAVS